MQLGAKARSGKELSEKESKIVESRRNAGKTQRKVAKTHEAQRNQRAKAYTACKTRNANLVAEFEQQRRAYSEAVQQVQETEEKTEERRAWVAVYRWRWIWIFLNLQFAVLGVLVKLFA